MPLDIIILVMLILILIVFILVANSQHGVIDIKMADEMIEYILNVHDPETVSTRPKARGYYGDDISYFGRYDFKDNTIELNNKAFELALKLNPDLELRTVTEYVLRHELAHFTAFVRGEQSFLEPHGAGWKKHARKMLVHPAASVDASMIREFQQGEIGPTLEEIIEVFENLAKPREYVS